MPKSNYNSLTLALSILFTPDLFEVQHISDVRKTLTSPFFKWGERCGCGRRESWEGRLTRMWDLKVWKWGNFYSKQTPQAKGEKHMWIRVEWKSYRKSERWRSYWRYTHFSLNHDYVMREIHQNYHKYQISINLHCFIPPSKRETHTSRI